jgi:hypothetical protein
MTPIVERAMKNQTTTIVAAAALWLTWTAAGQAQTPMGRNVGWFAFRNDTGISIYVQTASIAPNGKVTPGVPQPINPRGAAWEQVAGQGPKVITIFDAKLRVLAQGPVNFAGQDLYFSVQLDVVVRGNERIPVAKLVPITDPRQMAGMPGK